MSLRRSGRVIAATNNVAFNPSMPDPKKEVALSRKRARQVEARKPDARATSDMPPPPVTPVKRRRKGAGTVEAPPLTPTPTAVGLMAAPYSTGDIDDATPPPRVALPPREAQPHMTNAPLQTPRGPRILPRPHESMESGVTTANILQKACDHLIAVDPRFKAVIDAHPCHVFSPEGLAEPIDPFRSLVSGICGQQVSGAAAKSIKNKFVALYNKDCPEGQPHTWPTPEQVAATDVPTLRTAGLSQRKAEYVQGLAEKFATGDLSAQMLADAADEELMERLTAVRGLGRWSAEMFACFALKRLDILSTGDLGVQRGMAAFAGRDVAKLKAKGGGKWKYMSEQDMLDMSAKFAPYRSVFMWYMWRIEDVDVSVMQ